MGFGVYLNLIQASSTQSDVNAEWFGIYTNLILTLSVTLYGIYWLYKLRTHVKQETYIHTAYRYRAYCYWWYSWAAWVLAWLLILINKINPRHLLDVTILVFDNLNSISLIIVYFILTRGRDLNGRETGMLAIRIALSFASLYGAIYVLFRNQLQFAYQLHQTCSLCVAVFTPILVGWAFKLRFKTSVVLMVGCLYGFIQPIVYATQLRASQQGDFKLLLINIQPIVAMMVGFLKVVWAITCTKVLSSARASSKNLILVEESKPTRFWAGWSLSVGLHATILIAVYSILLVSLAYYYVQKLNNFATSLGVVTGVFSFWQLIWNVWKTTRKH